MKVAVVILHYLVEKVTIECIENILAQDYENLTIIVVDNNSNNGSYEVLKKQYNNNDKIYFTSIELNVGFAKANDLGYQIAKHKFNADIVLVINNDLMIEDSSFTAGLVKAYYDTKFDILGPDIINASGVHQNPLKHCIYSISDVRKAIMLTKLKLLFIRALFHFKINRKKVNTICENKEVENVPLHGSCIAFGKTFINRVEFPFFPNTFLFGEEDILFYRIQNMKMKSVYYPGLKVKHVEDASISCISYSSLQKRIFELKHSYNSLKEMKKLMIETQKSNN